ncbi:hypothetical protein SAMN02910293_01109 [Streptococcus henryi]|uniref:Uncharacterized protein n=2 Tax=Streptococcus henryi TaxID=439219 RepID=A0A1G6BMY6_9STRE|nr:hypothetical protein SAMN02910293_01109 [Streptococcus henryi]
MAVSILSISGFIYINKNLSTYCIYYVKHAPQTHAKNTNPEMVVILDNLVYLGESKVNGIRFDTDGSNGIINEMNSFILTQAPDSEKVQYVSMPEDTTEENYRTYRYDKSGRFTSYFYRKPGKKNDIYEETENRKQEAQTYVDEVINPIVEEMKIEPKINLQWLFNKKYQDRFN